MTLLPLAAAAQWHGAPPRTAPVRPAMAMRAAPMARPFMSRPGPMPVRGFHFRPTPPGSVMPLRPHGRPGSRSGHVGFGFGFGLGNYPFGVNPQNRCFSDAFFDPFFCTRRPTRFSAFSPFFASPFVSLPVVWDSSQDYSEAAAQQMAEQTAQGSAQASELSAQIEQLREELRQMREQQSAPSTAAAAAPARVQDEAPPAPTTLIFRDGRRSQVQNYAIVGNTLW